jgi:Flp pilus assembly protein CpaB
LLLGIACLAGATSFLLVRGYVVRVASTSPGNTERLVAAARDIPAGTPIARASLTTIQRPAAYAPADAIRSADQATGATARERIVAGEVLTEGALGRGGPIAALVPAGLRGATLPTSLPPGSVVPGDRIDVLATYAQGQPYTEVAVSDVEVLRVLPPAAAGYASDASRGPTLVVLTDAAGQERLAHARALAQLDVAVIGTSTPGSEAVPGAPQTAVVP